MVTAKLTEQNSQLFGSVNLLGKSHENREIFLSGTKSWAIEGDARGTEISCLWGALWVTQENDHRDHILYSGSKFVITGTGRVIAQGIGKGIMQVSE